MRKLLFLLLASLVLLIAVALAITFLRSSEIQVAEEGTSQSSILVDAEPVDAEITSTPPIAPDEPLAGYHWESNSIMTSITVISLIVAILSLFTSFWLYRWRVRLSDEQSIMVPEVLIERTDQQIKLLSETHQTIPELGQYVATQAKETNNKIEEIGSSLNRFQAALKEKDDEINRYKVGYDTSVYHRFIGRFFRIYLMLKTSSENEPETNQQLNKIKVFFEDALEESGVELFSPGSGVSYLDNNHIFDENIELVATDNSKNDGMVQSVLSPGLRSLVGDQEIIIKPKVAVFKFNGG
jgi:flagellar basal body-associated protein FliL